MRGQATSGAASSAMSVGKEHGQADEQSMKGKPVTRSKTRLAATGVLQWTSAALLAAFIVAFAAGSANAQRPDTRAMTCAGAWAFVQANGAVVMSTGRYTYDRLVSQRRYCELNEVLQRHFAQTADSPRCFVGYVCRGRNPGVGSR